MKNELGVIVGKLIIDGNSVFEIDEECIKKKKLPKDCGVEKYITNEKKNRKQRQQKKAVD